MSGSLPGAVLDAYHLLARRGELSPAQLAIELGLSPDQTRSILAELASLRLVRETEDGTAIAIPHSQAIDELLAEQAVLLAHALDHLFEGRRRLRTVVDHRATLDPIEASRITSTELGTAGRRGMFDLSQGATETISALHPGSSFSDDLLERSFARAMENLRNNVRMRVVHQTSVLGRPAVAAYLSELAARGCRVRLRDNLPFRMLLLDGNLAICSVPISGSYLLRGERVMVLLSRVFETTWVDAMPLETALSRARRSPGSAPADRSAPAEGSAPAEAPEPDPAHDLGQRRPGVLNPTQEAILRLLAEGETDQSIARSLGITTRTVTRRIGEIYEVLGVESRFQAGVAAKELGIV